MSDLVSRQAAIDLLLENGMITAAILIERVPTAQGEIIFIGKSEEREDE